MAKFKCTHEHCEMFDKEVRVASVKWIYSEEKRKLVPMTPIVCEKCGMELEYIKNEGVPSAIQSFSIGKFDGLSSSEKRAVMHKRSMDHFKKTDKGDLDRYKKQIILDNRKMAEGRE
jgi:hypothetical protein